jgi:DNA-binding HxlR family transcriptional regulator
MTDLSTTKPIRRKALNKDQLNILYTLYKFRFGTTDLLRTTQSKQISRQYINTRLRILCEQEYIGRRYDSSYKLQAKFAQYYLLPKGIEILRQHPEIFNVQILKNIKKDVNASESFARHAINIFKVCAKLKEQYGDTSNGSFHFYTKSYMVGYIVDSFPKPLPDAFASFRATLGRAIEHYIIECFDDTMPQSVMRKRIEQLVDHADSDEWSLTKSYPNILLVCEIDRIQKSVQRWVTQESYRGWSNDLAINVVALDANKWEL